MVSWVLCGLPDLPAQDHAGLGLSMALGVEGKAVLLPAHCVPEGGPVTNDLWRW